MNCFASKIRRMSASVFATPSCAAMLLGPTRFLATITSDKVRAHNSYRCTQRIQCTVDLVLVNCDSSSTVATSKPSARQPPTIRSPYAVSARPLLAIIRISWGEWNRGFSLGKNKTATNLTCELAALLLISQLGSSRAGFGLCGLSALSFSASCGRWICMKCIACFGCCTHLMFANSHFSARIQSVRRRIREFGRNPGRRPQAPFWHPFVFR